MEKAVKVRFFQHERNGWDIVVQRNGHPSTTELEGREEIPAEAAVAILRLVATSLRQRNEFRDGKLFRDRREAGKRLPNLKACFRSYLTEPTALEYLEQMTASCKDLWLGLCDSGAFPDHVRAPDEDEPPFR